ncbi:alpha-L-rhamnosidase [Marinoscillum sp. MHG1-6]|uniref:alpha-L-rhamnosidase n=1 Tax=Marinoscillum sp. MHG1-6 TaxID=2959627 RepID=UPI0021580FAB|nr:alpha-L-rhamnosidase [Marinoscillum sp. MHG1-6]
MNLFTLKRKFKYIGGLICLAFWVVSCSSQSAIRIDGLTVEFLEKPLGIDSRSPCFGWKLKAEENGVEQRAYQITVLDGSEEVWKTGKVISDKSQRVSYQGAPLKPDTRYDFKVQVWDQKDRPTETKSSWFHTAPDNRDLKAEWIGAIRREDAHLPEGRAWHSPSLKKYGDFYDSIPEMAMRSIMIRKEIDVTKQIKIATVFISGLGHYELNVNGTKVGKSVFAPLWTDYDKTVFYNTYDLTTTLKSGANAFGVLLGNGMYNVIGNRYRKFWVSFGPPTLFFQLEIEYQDGEKVTIQSDQSWKYSESPITFNCVFGGEDYDANLEQEGWARVGFDDESWYPVVVQGAPGGNLKPQMAPAVEVQEKYNIKNWFQADSSTYVFDMGQNLSGYPTLKVQGSKGQRVKLIVGERLKDSLVTQRNTGGPHYYEYMLKGDGVEEWTPRFSYYGYQYIQAEGVSYGKDVSPDLPRIIDLKSNFVYSNAQPLGEFACSNEIFTKTHTLINNAIKSNMQAVFTDCPHREKLGWIEEIQLVGPGLLYNYDLTQLLRKSMMDMADAQRANGMVPNIAPEYTDFSAYSWGADFTDSPEWGAAVVLVPWLYYEYYGDGSLISEYFEVMKRYVNYLTSRSENHIVSHGLGDWYDYGDHAAGYSKNSPIALSATSHYYLCALTLEKSAELLGDDRNRQVYGELAEKIRVAFNEAFLDAETKQYGTGSQYSNAVAVYMGLADQEDKQAVLQNLVTDIESHGWRLTTGDVGNRYLFQALAENGLNEVMYKMLNHYEAPGYGYQLQYGLTTLTEQWDPAKGNSWNHFMMGQVEEWFFKSILGIVSDINEPGFKHYVVQPDIIGDITWAKGGFETLYGKIAVNWSIQEGMFSIQLEVPVNASATFIIPDGLEEEGAVELVSGQHSFTYAVSKN